MGQFIVTGLTTQIKIIRTKCSKLKYEDVYQHVLKYYPLELFYEAHDEDIYCWKVNTTIFQEGFVDFLTEYLNIYGDYPKDLIEKICLIKNPDDILNIANEKSFCNFQIDEYGESHFIRLPLNSNLIIMPTNIILTMDGKIMTEGISDFLNFTTYCLRESFSKYPVGLLLNAYITG
jgi:hypothetical protein